MRPDRRKLPEHLNASKVLEPLKKDFATSVVLQRLDEADAQDKANVERRLAQRQALDLGES